MDSFRFRPFVGQLEERETPSVTPGEVFSAAQQIEAHADALNWIANNLDTKTVFLRRAELSRSLPGLSNQNGDAANTLGRFIVDAQETIASGGGTPALTTYITQANELIAQGRANQAFAATLAIKFGASPQSLLPPAPPVVPPPAPPTSPETPTIPTNADGTPIFNDDNLANSIPTDLSTGFRDINNGLLVKDVFNGVGDRAVQIGETVTVDYTGWLKSDGTQFDSSRTRGEPATFSLNQVISGWQLGIPGMKPGGIRQLVIPAAQAYGATGSPPSIPPNADLVFEVRLRSIGSSNSTGSTISQADLQDLLQRSGS